MENKAETEVYPEEEYKRKCNNFEEGWSSESVYKFSAAANSFLNFFPQILRGYIILRV